MLPSTKAVSNQFVVGYLAPGKSHLVGFVRNLRILTFVVLPASVAYWFEFEFWIPAGLCEATAFCELDIPVMYLWVPIWILVGGLTTWTAILEEQAWLNWKMTPPHTYRSG